MDNRNKLKTTARVLEHIPLSYINDVCYAYFEQSCINRPMNIYLC